ncbi:MAG TPA: LPS assembly protein LptD, partial [Candidatus Nitrosotenuis sp.]|nr:LPS assembly protein LptD [Candidatus Nitrosotenuis sp.]
SGWMRETTGDFLFFDEAELVNQMSNGTIQEPKALLVDDSRAAGRVGKLYDKNKSILWQGIYSPCEVCQTNPDKAPLWQLKASKIIHDKEEQTLTYHNVWMEFFGFPTLYAPYFSHPDPTVKRKSGFLPPSYGASSDLGPMISIPYFWVIDDSKDLTLVPVLTWNEGPVMSAEYRQRFVNSMVKTSGSFVKRQSNNNASKRNQNNRKLPPRHRWHFFFTSRHELTDDHLLTIDINRASDTTYIRRYPVLFSQTGLKGRQTTLTSTAALEQFKPNSYGVIQGYYFQSDNKITPVVLPTTSYTYETTPGQFAETWQFDVNVINMWRQRDVPGLFPRSTVRGSGSIGFQVPYVTPLGDIWQLRLYSRGDLYFLKDFAPKRRQYAGNSVERRFFPQAILTWRYPFLNRFDSSDWVIEPAAMIIGGSTQGNSIQIPNEDSPTLIIDQSNVFLPNRFYGYDRVDRGSRVVYGFHNRHYFEGGRKIFFFFGQTIRLDHEQVLPNEAGEDRNASDLVASVRLIPTCWFEGESRVLMSRRTGDIRVAESRATLKFKWFEIGAGHHYYSKKYTINRKVISQLDWQIRTPIINKISAGYHEVRNLKNNEINPDLLSREADITYHHQCLGITLQYKRSDYKDRDLKPSHTVILALNFKNLGTFVPFKHGIFGASGNL